MNIEKLKSFIKNRRMSIIDPDNSIELGERTLEECKQDRF